MGCGIGRRAAGRQGADRRVDVAGRASASTSRRSAAVAGIFAVLGLFGSVPAGVVIAAVGARRVLLCGLAAIALGAASRRARAVSLRLLLASRMLKGSASCW